MNTSNITNMMEQQIKVLKELDELINNSERNGTSVPQADIDNLRNYVSTMKKACNTALLLARGAQATKPAPEPVAETNDDEAGETPAETEKPKKPRSSKKKKEEPVEAPPVEEDDDDLDFLD